jgi:hypothetical protein
MLGSRRIASRAYSPSGQRSGTGIRVWMAPYPRA